MPRYLIRSGPAGDWMVWDRVRRGAATLDDRMLARLSRGAAEAAFARLLAVETTTDSSPAGSEHRWQVTYGNVAIDCHDEQDSKLLALKLMRKGVKVVAQLRYRREVLRIVEHYQMRAWFAE